MMIGAIFEKCFLKGGLGNSPNSQAPTVRQHTSPAYRAGLHIQQESPLSPPFMGQATHTKGGAAFSVGNPS